MKNLKFALTISLCALALACGDDPVADNNNTNTNNGMSTGSNNGMSTGSNNGMSTGSNNGMSTGSNNGTTTPTPEGTGCDAATPPARCTADAAGFAWGTASVMTKLEVEGNADCCFDYNGDNTPDNALGSTLGSVMGGAPLNDLNDSISENIASGVLVPILEHEGLTALDADGNFTTNFFLGAHDVVGAFSGVDAAGGNKVLIDPASIDMGTQPLAHLPGASLTAATGKVVAGPGAIALDFELFGSQLNLVISRANIEADAVAADSGIGAQGIALTNGKLGGVIKADDIFGAVNNVAANCECLELPAGTPLIENGVCNADAVGKQDSCVGDEESCKTLAGSCSTVGAVAFITDAESTPGSGVDSVSLGASIEAVGAEITGLETE